MLRWLSVFQTSNREKCQAFLAIITVKFMYLSATSELKTNFSLPSAVVPCRIPLPRCGKVTQTAWVVWPITDRQECVSSTAARMLVCTSTAPLDTDTDTVFSPLTCGQGRGAAQGPRTVAPPQQPSRWKLRCRRQLRQSGRKVCREAPQRCSHRHLHSVCVCVHSCRVHLHLTAGARTIPLLRAPEREEEEEGAGSKLQASRNVGYWNNCRLFHF